MSNGNQKKRILKYDELLKQLIDLLSCSLKQLKESKTLEQIKQIGFDKQLFLEEVVYLKILALTGAIRSRIPKNWEKISEDLTVIIGELGTFPFLDLESKLKSKHKLVKRLADYMDSWNVSLNRKEKIKDNSLMNNPIFTISNAASINAFGDKGKDIRVIMLFAGVFMDTLTAFNDFLSDCDLNQI